MKKIFTILIVLNLLILSGCTFLDNFIDDGTYKITFNTGGGTKVSTEKITTFEDQDFNVSHVPNYVGHVFLGWYLDIDANEPYIAGNLYDKNLTLYAKYAVAAVYTYEIEDSTLSWNPHPNARYYELRIMSEDTLLEPFAEIEESFIDLRPQEFWFHTESEVHVFAVFDVGITYKLFDVTLIFDYVEATYEENFEDDTFLARTNYSNNANPRIDGPENFKFHILNGTASITSPIEGTKSIQLRNNLNTPYLETGFTLENMARITFLAKSNNHHLRLTLINEIGITVQERYFELTSNAKRYSINVTRQTALKIRFELLATSDITVGEQIFIDDIKVYSVGTPTALFEIKKVDEPDPDLEAIIARFATQRHNLTPPGFNALSEAGKLEYYASLNGLTGEAFRQELNNILTSTHQRLISYDEARFILEQSDLVVKNNKRYLDGIYSGHEIIPYWDGGATWAREHVWPNSRLGIPRVGASSRNQGSDVHNLRAINPSVNSSRSNRYFLDGDAFGLVGTEGYYPGDAYKGDVARILFYMLARYPNILTLRDDNIIDSAYTAQGTVMGILSLLIEWHYDDPVSEFEIHRNEVIYTYQGNRNPFIDNPEYVDVYFN